MTMVFIYWERDVNGCADYKKPHTFEIDLTGKDAMEIMRECNDVVDNIDPFVYTAPEFSGII